VELARYDAVGARPHVGDFLGLYAQVYGVAPYAGDPFFSVDTYRGRLAAALGMPGFEIVVATVGGRVVGTAHGVTLPAGVPWWRRLAGELPERLVAAAGAGGIFWLRELMVLSTYRGNGLGRRLHDVLLGGRAEAGTALTVIVGNEPARGAYLRWGYRIVGTIRHAPESPVYEAMIAGYDGAPPRRL
jgi:GNAT superfamily N-acetyltransferase